MIYLDNAATTKISQRALEAMLPYFDTDYANASSLHASARRARSAVEKARASIAASIHAAPQEIIFTGGGTESDVQVLRTFAALPGEKPKHILASAVEHPAILNTLSVLEQEDLIEAELLPVTSEGIVLPETVKNALRPDTALVSVMTANNEVGSLMPIKEIGELCHENGTAFHTDAVQAVGHMPIDVSALPVDYLSASGHKFHGPKGIGFLYHRKGMPLKSFVTGGHQENGLRAGTENVPAIIGMAEALSESCDGLQTDMERISGLREKMVDEILSTIPNAVLHGSKACHVPGICSFRFEGVSAEQLLILLDMNGICASGGSACTAGALEPSHVLLAMGVPAGEARGAVRFSLSRYTTEAEVDEAVECLKRCVLSLRG